MRKDKNSDERGVSWKVLLPMCQENRVLAIGLHDSELHGFTRTYKHVDASPNDSRYDIIVFGDQFHGPQPYERYLSYLTPNGVLVAVCSSRKRDLVRQSRWRYVAEYACLPSNQPRIFVPLVSKQVRNIGLDFHSPGSLQRKAWLWGAKGLSYVGITAHLRHKTVTFFTTGSQMDGEDSLKHWISRRIGWSVDWIIIYAGSESPTRKITALGMSSDCHKQIVARIGDADITAAAIRRESAALRVLAQSPLADSVPALISEGECGSYVIQLQSCLPKARGQYKTLSNVHISFLSALSRINRISIPIHRTAAWHIVSEAETSPKVGKLPEAIRHIASRLLNNGTADKIVECHMIHGDFASWNIIYQNDSILVYDWEESNPAGFPFHDVFHFIYRQASLVGPWPGPAAILKMMRDAAGTLAHSSDIRCDVMNALALWCIREYTVKPDHRLIELAVEIERTKHE